MIINEVDMMINLPPKIVSTYNKVIAENGFFQKLHSFYLKWLRYYLVFFENVHPVKQVKTIKLPKRITAYTFRHRFDRHLLQAN